MVKLRVASRIQITADEIKAWLQQFCHGDLFDMDFRRRIIDVFINAIYLYDDKVVMYFNIRDSKQVSYIEMLDDLEKVAGSDLTPCGSPKRTTFLRECRSFWVSSADGRKLFEAGQKPA